MDCHEMAPSSSHLSSKFLEKFSQSCNKQAIVAWSYGKQAIDFSKGLTCHAKIGLARPILEDNFSKIGPPRSLLLPKSVGQTNFGSQNWSPFANFGPSCKI